MASGIARGNGVCMVCTHPIVANESTVKWAPSRPGSIRHESCFGQPDAIPQEVAPLIQIQEVQEVIPAATRDEVYKPANVNMVPDRKGIDIVQRKALSTICGQTSDKVPSISDVKLDKVPVGLAVKLAEVLDGHVPLAVQNYVEMAISAAKQHILADVLADLESRKPPEWVTQAPSRLSLVRARYVRRNIQRKREAR